MSSLSSLSPSSLSSGRGPSGMTMSPSLSSSSSLLSLSDISDRAAVSLKPPIFGQLTSLGIRHARGWHAERVVRCVVVDAALWIAKRPVGVVQVCHARTGAFGVGVAGVFIPRPLLLGMVDAVLGVRVRRHVLLLQLADVFELGFKRSQPRLALVVEFGAVLELSDLGLEVCR